MKYLKSLSLVFLFIYVAKFLFLQANLNDVFIMGILLTLSIVIEVVDYKSMSKKDSKKIDDLVNKINELEKNHNELKTHISGLQMGNQMKYNVKR